MENSYVYRTAEADDWSNSNSLLSEAFNEDTSDEWSAMERGVFEPDRTVLVETAMARSSASRPRSPVI